MPEGVPFDTTGLEVVPVTLFINHQGNRVNALGERCDELGRLTKPRGAKGKGSSRNWRGYSRW